MSDMGEVKVPEQITFRLLDLPPELQLQIIELTVTEEAPICMNRDKDDNEMDLTTRTQPALSRVSRAIRTDALKLYYSRNDFTASYCVSESDLRVLRAWLRCIGPTARGMLRSLRVYNMAVMAGADDDVCFHDLGGEELGLRDFGAMFEDVVDMEGAHVVSFPKHVVEE